MRTRTEPSADDEGGTERRYRAVVVFRNDDPEPGHRDDLRRAVADLFLEAEVPLTSAVIPVQDGESIAGTEFCSELRRDRSDRPDLVEYALHGYLHEPNGRGGRSSEFAGLPYDEQRARLTEGIRVFVDCLGETPRSFVPPYATYDEATVRALSGSDVDVVSGSEWFTRGRYGEPGVFETNGVLHVPSTHEFVRDWETLELHDEGHLRDRFDAVYERGGLYVQLLHYWTFDTGDRFGRLRSFVRYVADHDDVLCTTIGRFADAYRSGRLTRAENGWVHRPAPAPDDPDGP